ncbi:MAG: hypothetical protein AAF607_11900 [Pseudomonadota bacterium]
MRAFILAGAIVSAMVSPVYANDCGEMPAMPAHFDPATAGKSDILKLKAEFEAYKTANTQFIECLKSGASTSSKKQLIDTTIDAEQKFAKRFNANAKAWVKNQSQQG